MNVPVLLCSHGGLGVAERSPAKQNKNSVSPASLQHGGIYNLQLVTPRTSWLAVNEFTKSKQ